MIFFRHWLFVQKVPPAVSVVHIKLIFPPMSSATNVRAVASLTSSMFTNYETKTHIIATPAR